MHPIVHRGADRIAGVTHSQLMSPSVSAAAPERPTTVVIIDDHPLVREGLRRVLDDRSGSRLVAEADSVEQALALDLADVEVCTLDLSMPGTSGLDGISALRAKWPSVKILVLTVHGADTHAAACAERGADGFLSKSAPPSEIRAVLSRLAAGERHFPATADGDGSSPPMSRFSQRELEVVRMLDRGQRVTEIAEAFGVSVKTISSQKMSLQRKLGAANTAQILERARAQGLLA
jgi:DNA-binding NarL/FixJ family response regulator